MITLKHITKIFREQDRLIKALDDVSLHVQAGSIHGIIGQSGAGKSSLLRSINLLEHPDQGEVCVEGQEITALSPAALCTVRREIGMIFQHYNLLSTKTVFENIALPLYLDHSSKKGIADKVNDLLHLVGLGDYAERYPAQLSGGQKQRVAVARALIHHPKVLLCDEPTSALDLHATHSLLQLLADINEQLSVTLVLITHELAVVKQICDRVTLLDAGKVIEESDVASFFFNPQSELGHQLIRSDTKEQLPLHLQEALITEKKEGYHPVVRISFRGEAAGQPVISALIKTLGVAINIHMGNIDIIQRQSIGTLLVEIDADANLFEQVVVFMNERHVAVEVLGYVCNATD